MRRVKVHVLTCFCTSGKNSTNHVHAERTSLVGTWIICTVIGRGTVMLNGFARAVWARRSAYHFQASHRWRAHRSPSAAVNWSSGRVRQAWFCTKVSKHCRLKHPVFSCFLAFVCLLLMHSSHHAQSIYLFTFQWTLDRHQAKRFGYVSYCRRIYVIQTSDAIIGELKSSRIVIKSWHFCVLNIGGICVVFKVCIKSKLASWLIVFV